MQWSHLVPLAPPFFTVGMIGWFGASSAFLRIPTRRLELMPKSSILVSPDPRTFFQAFSESFTLQRSVLPMMFLVQNALRSLTCSSCVAHPMRHDLAPDRGWLMVIIFLLVPNNHTNSSHLLIKLLAVGLVAHSSLVQDCNCVPDVLWQLVSVSRGGREVGVEEIDSLDRCGLYT